MLSQQSECISATVPAVYVGLFPDADYIIAYSYFEIIWVYSYMFVEGFIEIYRTLTSMAYGKKDYIGYFKLRKKC